MTRGCDIPSVIHIVRRQGAERGLENDILAVERSQSSLKYTHT